MKNSVENKRKWLVFLAIIGIIVLIAAVVAIGIVLMSSGKVGNFEFAGIGGKSLEIEWDKELVESDFTQEDVESDTIQWICATYAIYTERNCKRQGCIGGAPYGESWYESAIGDALERGWGITDRESAIETINWILEEGHRTKYQKEIARLERKGWLELSRNDYWDEVLSKYDTERYLTMYDAYQEFGKNGIDAWDYCRATQVLGDCYICGYISLEECLDQSLEIAEYLQKEFDSWEEVGMSYLYGFEYWTKETNEETRWRWEIYDEFLEDEESPYGIDFDLELENTWK